MHLVEKTLIFPHLSTRFTAGLLLIIELEYYTLAPAFAQPNGLGSRAARSAVNHENQESDLDSLQDLEERVLAAWEYVSDEFKVWIGTKDWPVGRSAK